MRVFITGASGWIGSATAGELLEAGHQVVGLARSAESAKVLEQLGATPLLGDLDDLDGLRRAADAADGVVHLANKHDWSNPASSNAAERAAVDALAGVLVDSGRPLLVASGLAGLVTGRAATEADPSPATGPDSMRGGSENLALGYAGRGVRAVGVRFAPTVHGARDPGFVAAITEAARRRGVSGHVDGGAHAWAAVHRSDAARLLRLGLEGAPAGSVLHAVAEQAVPTRAIAEAVGHVLGLPTTSVPAGDAVEHFGFVGRFFGLDMSASSARTRELLGWTPTGPTLIDDITAGAYTA